MPRPSAFDEMTPEELRAFAREFERRHFKKVDSMVEWLTEQGFDISRSAVGRKGQALRKDFQRNLDMVKSATLGAEIIAETTKDDNGKLADGLIALVQGGLFDVMSNLSAANESDDPEERMKLLSNAARASADVGRASIATKKFRREVETEVRKAREQDAALISKAAKAEGVSEQGIARMRDALGITA